MSGLLHKPKCSGSHTRQCFPCSPLTPATSDLTLIYRCLSRRVHMVIVAFWPSVSASTGAPPSTHTCSPCSSAVTSYMHFLTGQFSSIFSSTMLQTLQWPLPRAGNTSLGSPAANPEETAAPEVLHRDPFQVSILHFI